LVRAGREATPQQYAEKYDLDVCDWPSPDDILRPTYRTYVEPRPSALAREVCEVARPERSIPKMPRVGDRFLHFELISELGRGTFGRVFVARQTNLADRLVALKVAANLGGESDKLARLQTPTSCRSTPSTRWNRSTPSVCRISARRRCPT